MKPTYDEVIEAMAFNIPIGNQDSEVRRVAARAALNALQDMMPEPEPRYNHGLQHYQKIDQALADKGRLYNHFKTMGR